MEEPLLSPKNVTKEQSLSILKTFKLEEYYNSIRTDTC